MPILSINCIILLMSTTNTELPRYTGENVADPALERSDVVATRRQVLIGTGAVVAMAAGGDQALGFLEQLKMKHNPEAYIFANPTSNLVMVTVPGNRNDGLVMGSLLHEGAFGESNMVAVSYADDSIDPIKLAALIKSAVDSVEVPNPEQKRVAFYLNSIAAAVCVPVFELLHAHGMIADLVLIDSGLRTRGGLRGAFNEGPAQLRLDKAGHSRVLNRAMKTVVGSSIPPADHDRDPSVDVTLARLHRWRTVNCDTITQGAEAASLDYPIRRGSLRGFASAVKYIKTDGTDPLIESEKTVAQLQVEYGQPIEIVVDTDRAYNSHGTGPIYPKGLLKTFRKFFGITPRKG